MQRKETRPTMAQHRFAGCGEIDAAKKRLVVAKKWEASTVDTLDAAEMRLNDARDQVEYAEERKKDAKLHVEDVKLHGKSARDEVMEAAAYLKSVEQKWKVIDVDDDSPTPKRNKRKRRDLGIVSPTMWQKGDNSVVFDLHAIPGPLGLVLSNPSGALAVHAVNVGSQFVFDVEPGDCIIKFNDIDTKFMPSGIFVNRVMNGEGGQRKITFRRHKSTVCLL